jgi:hypothetical protein
MIENYVLVFYYNLRLNYLDFKKKPHSFAISYSYLTEYSIPQVIDLYRRGERLGSKTLWQPPKFGKGANS